ncbi:autotransporter strand-loop-strand O-heptosyltransferase, partial [Escherichia coli]|nr:autotransporter strand-loop-strand O-heptosyltransferase [Escherichia coli]
FHRSAGYILGVDPREAPVRLDLSAPRVIQEPYVCIATQSTCQAKYWNNGTGWSEVVAYLKSLGYRVLCIDRDAHYGQGFV